MKKALFLIAFVFFVAYAVCRFYYRQPVEDVIWLISAESAALVWGYWR